MKVFLTRINNNLLYSILLGCFLFPALALAQVRQTIRGIIIDAETHSPLQGAVVICFRDSLVVGSAQSDATGNYVIEEIPLGRVRVEANFLGYSGFNQTNIILNAARETIIDIALETDLVSLQEVEIIQLNKMGTVNEMALTSARTFSVAESERYAGSRGDPARMASNFAGAQGSNDSRNDLVIRGNTPLGLTYRLEDIDIPNPNHFAVAGTMGGPVSILNNKVLSNSDFITGAFPSEYGNAISGIFDLKMRKGNSKRHEFMGQIGVLGTELMAEGPITKNSRSSYLANFRYSTLKIFEAINFNIGTSAVPNYFDGSFKLHFPIKNNGAVSLFGIGGRSKIDNVFSTATAPAENIYGEKDRDQYFRSSMAVIGIAHEQTINHKIYSKTTIAYAPQQSKVWHIRFFKDQNFATIDSLTQWQLGYQFIQNKTTLGQFINYKFTVRSTLRAGFQLDRYDYNFRDSNYSEVSKIFISRLNFSGNAYLVRPYIQWKYKFNNALTMNLGMHYQRFFLNQSQSLEPRAALKYQIVFNKSIAFGYGLHSQLQQGYLYFQPLINTNILHNRQLEFTKSHHFVISYDWQLATYLRLKMETYYQKLFNIPVTIYPSSFSLINQGGTFQRIFPPTLINAGSGENYGIEVTVEKFFSKSYYFMATGSVYNSKYSGSDGIERNTDYNGNFALNLLAGTEREIGKSKKTTLIFGGKLTWAGGRRYGPVDTVASRETQNIVYANETPNTLQFKNYFRADVKVGFKANSKKVTYEVGMDVVNILNTKNILGFTYAPNPADASASPLQLDYQLGFLPLVYLRVDF